MGDYATIDPDSGRLILDISNLPEGGTAVIQETPSVAGSPPGGTERIPTCT